MITISGLIYFSKLLCQILLLVSQVVGAVGLKVVQPLIAEIG